MSSLDLSFRIVEYTEPVTNLETVEETGDIISYRDYVKIDEPHKGQTLLAYLAFEKKQKRLWAFADPVSIPSNRYLAITAFVTLAQLDPTPDDLQSGYKKITELLTEGETTKALEISQKCEQVITLIDPVQKWLNIATAFLMFDNENPLFYDKKIAKEKLGLIQSLSSAERKNVAEWTREYFDKLIQTLIKNSPECFVETSEKRDFFEVIQDLVQGEKDMKDFLNAVASKSSTERDRLLMYPIKTLYDDMSIFIRSNEKIRAFYEDK